MKTSLASGLAIKTEGVRNVTISDVVFKNNINLAFFHFSRVFDREREKIEISSDLINIT